MEMPSVEHPKTIVINGFKFKVVAYCELTDQQAQKIAIHFFRSRKFKKKDQKLVHTIITMWDKDSLGYL